MKPGADYSALAQTKPGGQKDMGRQLLGLISSLCHYIKISSKKKPPTNTFGLITTVSSYDIWYNKQRLTITLMQLEKKAQIMEFSLHKILSGKTNQLNTQAAKDDVGLQICNYCYDF